MPFSSDDAGTMPGAYGKPRLRNDSADRIREQTAKNTETLLRNQLRAKEVEIEQLKVIAKQVQESEKARRLHEVDALAEYILSLGLELPDAIVDLIAARAEQIVEDNLPSSSVLSGFEMRAVPDGAVLMRTQGGLVWKLPDGTLLNV